MNRLLTLAATVAALLLQLPSAGAQHAPAPRPAASSISGHAIISFGLGTGYGTGLEAEHILGKQGRLSIALPVSLQFATDKSGLHNGYGLKSAYRLVQAAPTLRYHPFSAYHPTGISIGIRAACGLLHTKQESEYPPISSYSLLRIRNFFFFSPQLELAINFRRPNGTIYNLYGTGGPILNGDTGIGTDNQPLPRNAFIQIGLRVGGLL